MADTEPKQSWKIWHLAVLASLILYIIIFYLITLRFS